MENVKNKRTRFTLNSQVGILPGSQRSVSWKYISIYKVERLVYLRIGELFGVKVSSGLRAEIALLMQGKHWKVEKEREKWI